MNDLGSGGLGTHGEGAAQLGDALGGGAGSGELVALELHDLLLDLHGHGDDLIVEAAGILGGLGLLLGGSGEGVLLGTGDTPHVVDVLGGGAHVIVVESVPQAVLDHGVDHLLVAHASAPAGVGSGIGSGAHVLGTAADDDVAVTGQDGAGALDDGLHAGAADHTHGVGGNGIGDTGLDGDLAGDVLAQTGGQDAAEHDLVHVLGSDVGALQGLLDHDGAHLGSGGVLQGAAEGTNCGSAAIDDIQFFHVIFLLFFVQMGQPMPRDHSFYIIVKLSPNIKRNFSQKTAIGGNSCGCFRQFDQTVIPRQCTAGTAPCAAAAGFHRRYRRPTCRTAC